MTVMMCRQLSPPIERPVELRGLAASKPRRFQSPVNQRGLCGSWSQGAGPHTVFPPHLQPHSPHTLRDTTQPMLEQAVSRTDVTSGAETWRLQPFLQSFYTSRFLAS
ncbi:hypothetical protein RRG08_019653 [Elysia crispata]|uniref:Uncharacterized protein n=1 Tax=Elysia crispata TaxID=231223 RepID=A0AAE1E7P5_9GAST|nr:hypothetical protein RRG08_019653 [Elysia crispata]